MPGVCVGLLLRCRIKVNSDLRTPHSSVYGINVCAVVLCVPLFLYYIYIHIFIFCFLFFFDEFQNPHVTIFEVTTKGP